MRYAPPSEGERARFTMVPWAHVDAGLSDHVTSKAHGGYVIFLMRNVIDYAARKTKGAPKSTFEAELHFLMQVVTAVLYQRRKLESLGIELGGPSPVFIDNSGVVDRVNSAKLSRETRYLARIVNFCRTHCATGDIEPILINTTNNVADLFTKAVPAPVFEKLSPWLFNDATNDQQIDEVHRCARTGSITMLPMSNFSWHKMEEPARPDEEHQNGS